MNDFRAEPTELRDSMLDACRQVMASGWYVLGREVERFESAWAAHCGVRHGVGVGNGMDAIEIALTCLGIGEGDEVITTPMTAFATVLAVIRAGATPVLADIDPETALMSQASVRRCISPRTRALLLVHLYGQVRDMTDWQTVCSDAKLLLIEDCAQAHGAELDGKRAGSFGCAAAFSFYPTKNLGALGDGGMLVTEDSGIASAAAQLRNYGQSERYHHPRLGLNSRLDELQAALLRSRLPWLSIFNERRRTIADAYRSRLHASSVRCLAVAQEPAAHVNHLFVVCNDKRNELLTHLASRGVRSGIHYPIPIHMQAPCVSVKRDPTGLASSETHAATCLSLPCHPQMTDEDVAAVIEAVNAF